MKIVSILFCICYLGILAFYLYRVSKRDILKSGYSLATNVITFIESFILTRLLVGSTNHAFDGLYKAILDITNGEWVKQAALNDFIVLLSTITVSILLFIILYSLLLGINHLLKRFIFHRLNKTSYKKYSFSKPNLPLNLGMGVISFWITTFVFLFPIASMCGVVRNSVKESNYEISSSVQTVVDNPVIRTYSTLGGKTFFDFLTNLKNSHYRIKNTKELEGILTIAMSSLQIVDEKDIEQNIQLIHEKLSSTYLVSGLLGELCANAANQFKDNKSFMGQKIEISDHQTEILLHDVFEVMSKWERDDFVKDLDTTLEVYRLLQEKDIREIKDGEKLLAALENEDFSKSLFLELFANRDFKTLIPTFMNFGINKLLEQFNIQSETEYIQTFNLDDFSKEDIENEAHIFSLVLTQIKDIKRMSGGEFRPEDFVNLYENIIEIKDSKLITDVLYNILTRLIADL